ncbi:MAG TPA: bifunctional diaminohydroxyphosphoribosylaminopyrimidine deaminase/5-amino-6-(5-phosphoribosylamino)uracil reductase RibD [Gemmatimonadaceae bacterium]
MTSTGHPATERDRAFMRRALTLAARGWGTTAPNPMVGAVVVQGDEIVGEGWHERYGGPHAEVHALAQAGERARGATLYVTLEPCAHVGRTPPCTDAVIAAGIARVVAATRDPNPEAAGGLERLARAGIATVTGVEEDDARELNAPFFHGHASDRPWTTLKLALSIDGAIASPHSATRWLTGELARREVHRLRAGCDAVAVGVGTARIDDPELTVRDAEPPRVTPARVVLDDRLELPLDRKLVRSARDVPTIVLATRGIGATSAARADALRGAGVEVVITEGLSAGMRALRSRGIRSLLVEGGAGVASALLSQRLVDRLVIFQAPILLGTGALPAFAKVHPGREGALRWRILRRQEFGADLMTVYAPEG